MSEAEEPVGQLSLVAYEKIAEHGLALPVFAWSFYANVFYTARSSAPGSASGSIVGFDAYEPDKLVNLAAEQVVETAVGEPWLDVFLWEGKAYVGTAAEIWDSIAEVRPRIARHAPLSLLGLAEGDTSLPASEISGIAFSWLVERYGHRKALEWYADTYLRGILLKALRRELGGLAEKTQMRLALQNKLIVQTRGFAVEAHVMPPLPLLPEIDVRKFLSAAQDHGFTPFYMHDSDPVSGKPERFQGNRTHENAMRVAVLQVAASKPEGKATTTELKNEVGQCIALTSEDMLPSKTRPNEAMYHQIIGNIVSHRRSGNNIFEKGWAVYTGDGIQITDAGRQYLRSLELDV
jgi:hypothetical protein